MPELGTLVLSLLDWYARNARDLPWRQTTDPYAIWISEVMLQQTQVKTVIPCWHRWMKKFPTINALARSKSDTVLKCWEGLGYYSRARNLHEAAQTIVSRHGGIIPRNPSEVLALPGIGRYTAGAICSIAFNLPEPILDGNAMRVLTRVFGIEKDPRENETNKRLWKVAAQLVRCAAEFTTPTERACANFNQALMELGATTCTPRQARCSDCPIQEHCFAYQHGRVATVPKTPPRRTTLSCRLVAFVVAWKGRFLVRRRPEGKINAHLWEFPNLEANDNGARVTRLARQCLGFNLAAIQPLCSIAHTITRYRIRLDVFRGTAQSTPILGAQVLRWCTLKQLDDLAFPSAHRKIVRKIQAQILQGCPKRQQFRYAQNSMKSQATET